MNFKQFLLEKMLSESLTSPIPYEWERVTPKNATASFNVDDKKYIVSFSLSENVSTRLRGNIISDVDFVMKDDNGSYYTDITGTGNSFKIFSTVIQIIKEFISKNNVDILTFSAEEPSRKKLYLRLANHFARGNVKQMQLEMTGETIFYIELRR